MTKVELERLKVLEKRRDWLQKRVFSTAENKADMSFDRAELSALEWAIEMIEVSLSIKDKECNHFWYLRNNDEVFCSRCLEIKQLSSQ